MKEQIGKVVIDYKNYPGQDLYSDGKVEDELLEISKSYKEAELNGVIAERNSWPVLYHFSHVRENIVNWLPIKTEETVLEIGSGCGAITGALAKKAKKVTCIELSKKRSLINAYRHQQEDNIEILLGNFQDVVNDITETFDYITLIGVFEYSQGYIQTEQPYVDMLKKISPLLKPNGKLIIAIENRFGLKYWAGCTEDHVGKYFEGLEDYPDTDGVRTFSKKELERIICEAGDFSYEMYYPYPDYKFPMTIYSDRRLPVLGELRETRYNFDRERVTLFDETRVYDSLISNELYQEFSNSFLVVLTKEEQLTGYDTAYVKFSNERAAEFSLRTEIRVDQKQKKRVFKLGETSQKHILHILDCYEKLSDLYGKTRIRLNKCIPYQDGIELEYIQGTTLEEVLDSYIEKKQYEKVWDMMKSYLDTLSSAATNSFVMTDEFKKVFGDVVIPGDVKCAPITNIDAICSNIILVEDDWMMLDYEWSFEFPIPVRFQLYRVLNYYLHASTMRGCLHELDFFARLGITKEEIAVYEEMEQHFQQYILGKLVPMRNMYDEISPGVADDVKSIRTSSKKRIHVYVDEGQDFTEENSFMLPMEGANFNDKIVCPEQAVRLRVDPCEEPCFVYISEVKGMVGDFFVPVPFICNGKNLFGQAYIFETEDPYFIFEQIPEGVQEICINMEVQPMAEHGMKMVNDISDRNHDLFQKNNMLNQKIKELTEKCETQQRLIQEMENTKVWKAYTYYKNRGKKA